MILPFLSSNFLMERSADVFDELEDFAAEPPSEEYFHTDLERLGGEERRRTEFGIVANGKIFGGERAADQREAHIPELNFAAERGGSFFFDGGTELVDGDQEWSDENQDNQNADDDKDDAELALHNDLQDGANEQSPDGEQGDGPIIICIGEGGAVFGLGQQDG